MRSALISMTGQPPGALAGKTLARRQLDFALAAGCESVIALGDGGSAEAIALRHATEAAGARFVAIRDSHGLLGAVGAADALLALAPGLLPESVEALDALAGRGVVLVLPAGPGVAAGFERIDLERAWAGAVVVSGAQVERLSALPADSEPASALMRIALQARVAEHGLPEAVLADGSWSMLSGNSDRVASEAQWLKRHSRQMQPSAPSQRLAELALRPLALPLLAAPRSGEVLMLGALAALAGAIVAAGSGLAPLGFALVPLGALLAQAALGLARLRDAPFGRQTRASLASILPWLVDATLFACAVLAIEGSWLHRLFPPLVMLGTLHINRSEWATLPGDRGLIGALLAVAAGFGMAEPAIMLVSLALLALNLAQSRAKSG